MDPTPALPQTLSNMQAFGTSLAPSSLAHSIFTTAAPSAWTRMWWTSLDSQVPPPSPATHGHPLSWAAQSTRPASSTTQRSFNIEKLKNTHRRAKSMMPVQCTPHTFNHCLAALYNMGPVCGCESTSFNPSLLKCALIWISRHSLNSFCSRLPQNESKDYSMLQVAMVVWEA